MTPFPTAIIFPEHEYPNGTNDSLRKLWLYILSEIIETVFCGKCGSAGNWDIIPQLLLEQMGFKIFDPEENMQPETKTEETNKGDSNEL